MNSALWTAQILLALFFFLVAMMKLTQPKEKLMINMVSPEDFDQKKVRIIGGLELLAAIALILPTVTGILPILTPIAALGLAIDMGGAIVTHRRRGETTEIIVNLIVMALALFVAIGYFVVEIL